MSNEVDQLPTKEELEAARKAKTPEPQPPLEYPIARGPQVIRLDPVTGRELPPQVQQTPVVKDEVEKANKRPPRRKADDGTGGIPDKFKGKTPEEIAEAYTNLERKYGSLANEVGSMRNIVERIATGKREDDLGLNDKPVEITSDELLNNPTEAIAKVVAAQAKNAPKLDDEIAMIRQEQAMDKFRDRHPEFEQDMGDPEFQKWLAKSAYRQRLAVRAAQDGDLDAADELFTGWEEIKATHNDDDLDDTGNDDDDDQDARARKLRAAHLERGGSRGVSQDFHKRVYSRKELIDLRINDPDRYYDPAMQDIITRAYMEGRVK